MKKLILSIFVLCISISFILGQRTKTNTSALIDKSKPAVFIQFLSLKEIKPDDPTDEKDNLFFEIKNNTKWDIWLQMSGVSKKEYGDASLYYAIKDKDEQTKYGTTQCHVCSVNPISSGRSIVFSIPLSYANAKDFMEIAFEFGWERDNKSIIDSYTYHTVSYSFYYLPQTIQIPGREKNAQSDSDYE